MSKQYFFSVASLFLVGCGPKPVLDVDTCENNIDNVGEVCFESPSVLTSPTPLFDAVLFDIDADTRPDLIASSTDGAAFIYRGDPNGGFLPLSLPSDKIFFNAPAGSKAMRVFNEDLNADDFSDLIFLVDEGLNRGAIYSLLRVNGDEFQTSVRSALSAAPVDGELRALDDGGFSLVSLSAETLEIQQGDEGGLFTNPRVVALNASAARDIALTSINDDSLPDLLLSDAFTSSIRMVAIDDGTFIDLGATLIPPSNHLEFVGNNVISSNAGVGSISFLRGLGNGDFEPLFSFFVGDEPRETRTADFDGDGQLDIAVTGGITSAFLRGLGNGEFQESNPLWSGADMRRLFIQDLTFDGSPDFFAVGALGLTFTPGRLGSLPDGLEIPLGKERPKAATLLDFDLDGDLDIALSINSGLLVAKNNAQGQFNFAAPTVIPLDPTPVALAAGDVDGDGDIDLVTLDPQSQIDPNSDGTGRIIVNQGGVFTAQAVLPISNFPPGTTALLPLDQNNDQKSDILALGRTPTLLTSDGQRFDNPQLLDAPDATQGVLTDINQDNIADLIAGQGDSVAILLGPSFTTSQTISINGNANIVSAGDVNQDQRVDLIVLDTQSPLLLVLFQQEDGSFASALTGIVPDGATGLLVGDVDANPGVDALVVGTSFSQVLAFDGQSIATRVVRGGVGLPIGNVAGLLLSQDIDGNGTVDLVLPAQERGLLVSRQSR